MWPSPESVVVQEALHASKQIERVRVWSKSTSSVCKLRTRLDHLRANSSHNRLASSSIESTVASFHAACQREPPSWPFVHVHLSSSIQRTVSGEESEVIVKLSRFEHPHHEIVGVDRGQHAKCTTQKQHLQFVQNRLDNFNVILHLSSRTHSSATFGGAVVSSVVCHVGLLCRLPLLFPTLTCKAETLTETWRLVLRTSPLGDLAPEQLIS